MARFGPARARALVALRLTNIVVFSVALAFALFDLLGPPAIHPPRLTSWPVGERRLEVVDKTGDSAWHEVTREAVRSWDDAHAGIVLTAQIGGGPCRYDGPRIEVCEVPYTVLAGGSDDPNIEGMTTTTLSHGHIRGAVIEVCADCDLTPARTLVVITHELGHAMGLIHTTDPTSVMYPTGGAERPSPVDDATLRKLYPPLRPLRAGGH